MKILKTNLLGIFAMVIAFGVTLSLSAFTSVENKRVAYTFYYDGPVPATVSEVEDVNNWKFDAEGQECDNEAETACTITIDKSHVDDTNPLKPILQSSANLDASASLSSAYVVGSADINMNISNKTL